MTRRLALFLLLTLATAAHAADTGPQPTTYPAQETGPARISFNFRDVDIREVLRAIGLAHRVNIVADRDVDGMVTSFLDHVTLETALDALTTPNNLTWERDGELIRVRKIHDNPFFRIRAGKITLHADNVPIGTFLDAAAKATGINFVTTDPIQMNITAHLTEQPVQDALIQSLRNNGLLVSPEGALFKVSPAKPPVKVEKDENYKLTVDAQGADIRSVFTALAKTTEENIILDVDVSVPSVTFYVSNAEFRDVLDAITSTYGLAWQKLGNLYRVYRPQAGVQLPVSIDEHGLISFDLHGADLGEIVRQIATKIGWNSVFHATPTEKINQRIDKLPVSEVMERLFENTSYAWILDTSPNGALTLVVGNPAIGSKEAALFLSDRYYSFRYLHPSDVVQYLPAEIPSQNVKIDDVENTMRLSGTSAMHSIMEKWVARKDTTPPQIEIEVLVLEVNREKANSLGIGSITGQEGQVIGSLNPGGAPTAAFTYTKGLRLNQTFSSSITALERQGVVEVNACPAVLVRSRQTANISVQREDRFTVTVPTNNPGLAASDIKTIPSGTILTVTPWVGLEGGIIHLTISAELSSASGQVSGTQLPTVSARRENTDVMLEDGQTIILGGLIQKRQNDASDRIPILGRIPVLGHLFGSSTSSKSATELIIYITPRLKPVGTGINRQFETDTRVARS